MANKETKKIEQVFVEFLKEQQVRLKPKTYRGYETTIVLFKSYLDGYGFNHLDEKDAKLFDELFKNDINFCEMFGPDKIGATTISEFLDYFMIRKVLGSKNLMKTVGRVIRKFVKWLNEKGYLNEEKYTVTIEIVNDLKDELPKVEELTSLIYDYIQDTPPENFTETIDGYFSVVDIEPGKLWLADFMQPTEIKIGPVFVSKKISSLCEVGWVICLWLGKTANGWQMLESGFVYPQ